MGSVDAALVAVQRASAVTFQTFLVVHLSSPLAACLGGEQAASGFQVLGRVWYQTHPVKEAVVVWASLGVHVVSGVLKRMLRTGRRVKRRRELERRAQQLDVSPPAAESTSRRPHEKGLLSAFAGGLNLHAWTGYLLVPLVLGHVLTHRIVPSRTASTSGGGPISPSFLSYAFVSRNLVLNPISAWTGYLSLVVLATYHAATGARVIASGGRNKARLPDANAKVAWAAAVGAVGIGLVRLRLDGRDLPAFLVKQYDVVLRG